MVIAPRASPPLSLNQTPVDDPLQGLELGEFVGLRHARLHGRHDDPQAVAVLGDDVQPMFFLTFF